MPLPMLNPRTTLAVHIAAAAICYQFGGSWPAALKSVNPAKLAPAWFEAADYVIGIINRPELGLLPPGVKHNHDSENG